MRQPRQDAPPAEDLEDIVPLKRVRRTRPIDKQAFRKRLGLTFAVTGIGLAAFLLYRTLSGYSFSEIFERMRAVSFFRLVLGLAFCAASYACLSAFDMLGLRYVGRRLPYPRVALAAFIGLSLGHSIGFAGLSSGAIRYRFYTRWGLTAAEVAKLVVFSGVTVGLGLLTLGGIVLIWRPGLSSQLTSLEAQSVRALGAGCLVLVAVYPLLAAFVPKAIRIRGWIIKMPSPSLAFAQIGLGTMNFALVAGCLHQALRSAADVNYSDAAAAFVLANTTTILTHVPGGLGVIEGVVTMTLPYPHLIGAVLVFRVIYFLVPLVLGIATFALAEAAFRRRDAQVRGRI